MTEASKRKSEAISEVVACLIDEPEIGAEIVQFLSENAWYADSYQGMALALEELASAHGSPLPLVRVPSA